MDYQKYKTGIPFWMFVSGISLGISGGTGYLFYDAWWGCWMVVILAPAAYKMTKNLCIERRKRQLKKEFCDVMTLVSGNLHAGYSLENALIQVQRSNGTSFPLMNQELMVLIHGITCKKRVETMLKDLAGRSGIDEIMEFANRLETAKRYGGNIPYLIRQLTTNMLDVELVETEIQTTVAAKRLEGRIMLIVPFGILAFMKITNPEYMCVLYDTIAGHALMTGILLAVGICAWWIEKIIRIEV